MEIILKRDYNVMRISIVLTVASVIGFCLYCQIYVSI